MESDKVHEKLKEIEDLKTSGRLVECKEAYDKLISDSENEANASEFLSQKLRALLYNNRGHTKYLMVDFNDAINDYNIATKLDPEQIQAFYNRGLISYRMGMFTKAICDMKKVLELDPNFTDAQLCLQQCEKDIHGKS